MSLGLLSHSPLSIPQMLSVSRNNTLRRLRRMKRVNKFRLRPTKEHENVLFNLCETSAVLWNELNYIRRQAFFEGRTQNIVLLRCSFEKFLITTLPI
jgi:hypothetical protein